MTPINLDGMTLEELQETEQILLLYWQYAEIKIKAMQARPRSWTPLRSPTASFAKRHRRP